MMEVILGGLETAKALARERGRDGCPARRPTVDGPVVWLSLALLAAAVVGGWMAFRSLLSGLALLIALLPIVVVTALVIEGIRGVKAELRRLSRNDGGIMLSNVGTTHPITNETFHG
jgi:hypothetical protein